MNINERILEIGPLVSPLIEQFPNHFYCDIKDTDAIVSRYKSDTNVDIEKIVPIDFVIENSFEETFKGIERFDSIVSSHVFEHLPNPIFFFQDISKILNENGKLIMLVPDKRYCFDYYRENSSFADMYVVYEDDPIATKHLILDSFSSVCFLNDWYFFWNEPGYLNIPQHQKKSIRGIWLF